MGPGSPALDLPVGIFFLLGLPVSVYVAVKQGFRTRLGWVYLVILAIIRIIGSGFTIAALEEVLNSDTTMSTVAAMFNSVGVVVLLLTFVRLLIRVNNDMAPSYIHPLIFRGTQCLISVSLLLYLTGAIASANDTEESNDSIQFTDGCNLRLASAFILLATFITLSCIALYFVARRRYVSARNRRILFACAANIAFLAIRIGFTVYAAFFASATTLIEPDGTTLRAGMQFLPEFAVFTIFIAAGLTSPSLIVRAGVKDQEAQPAAQRGIELPERPIVSEPS